MPVLFFIAPTVALCIWIFISTAGILRRQELNPIWRKRVIVLLALGVVAGVWFAFFRTYEVKGELRLQGFPVPFAISRLHEGIWKDFSPPPAVQVLARIADLLAGPAMALLPIKVAAFLKQAQASIRREA